MKLLHTSDFHIGKRLYDYDLSADHMLFCEWLLGVITELEVDYLLVTGDIFDQSNPAQEALRLYYSFLADLVKIGCKAIITAGNHDSPALIDAPAHILDAVNIQVIGSVPDDPENLIIPLVDKAGKLTAAIAAVPFLRDRDIRKAGKAVSYESRIEAVREGITGYYTTITKLMNKKYPSVPHLVTGHLFAQGALTSGTEREIQIGNQAGILEGALPSKVDYFALGHIHKSQDVKSSKRIRYCGAPLPLSFAEKDYEHKVILLSIKAGVITEEDIEIPSNRQLEVVSGSVEEVETQLDELDNPHELPLLVDVTIIENNYTPEAMAFRETIAEDFCQDGEVLILQSRIRFENTVTSSVNPDNYNEELEELTPEKIFDDIIQSYDEEERLVLKELFLEIKESVEEGGEL